MKTGLMSNDRMIYSKRRLAMMSMLKRSELKVGCIIKPNGFPEGHIITVENCSLENFIDNDNKKYWPCWTIRTGAPKPLHKYLLVDWGIDGIIIWKKSNLNFVPSDSKLWLERSGLEEMENINSNEPERFIYSILVYILDSSQEKPSKFYCIERLRNNQIFRYEGERINIFED